MWMYILPWSRGGKRGSQTLYRVEQPECSRESSPVTGDPSLRRKNVVKNSLNQCGAKKDFFPKVRDVRLVPKVSDLYHCIQTLGTSYLMLYSTKRLGHFQYGTAPPPFTRTSVPAPKQPSPSHLRTKTAKPYPPPPRHVSLAIVTIAAGPRACPRGRGRGPLRRDAREDGHERGSESQGRDGGLAGSLGVTRWGQGAFGFSRGGPGLRGCQLHRETQTLMMMLERQSIQTATDLVDGFISPRWLRPLANCYLALHGAQRTTRIARVRM
ncbi:hypothetical protein EDB89DRAFT_1908180 [Lactarius sanguifluus]|nr:hypothetical protein EDB89DRAFT_1908180 [Lactarius sanguifluus]